tara:strand:+ start:104 stop:331 length:228 start_codon:yes stop_codon:yes gene_type:complete
MLIVYFFIAFFYLLASIREIVDYHHILETSKSRDLKLLSKDRQLRARRHLLLSPVWPYLLYEDLITVSHALRSLK